MESVWDSIISVQGLFLLFAVIIFVVALFLVLRGLIGFVVTSVMLFVTVVSGYLISNNAIVHKIFHYDNPALPEHQVITPASIKHTFVEVYEWMRSGVCTETVKVVYDPHTIDNLDEAISRLQKQQHQLQSTINHLRSFTSQTAEAEEQASQDSR